jgi:hypothetical protein
MSDEAREAMDRGYGDIVSPEDDRDPRALPDLPDDEEPVFDEQPEEDR